MVQLFVLYLVGKLGKYDRVKSIGAAKNTIAVAGAWSLEVGAERGSVPRPR